LQQSKTRGAVNNHQPAEAAFGSSGSPAASDFRRGLEILFALLLDREQELAQQY
jgi:hypothetical protein